MIKRIFIICIKTISLILSLLFLILTLLFIRLSIKPMDASFLLPLIERKLDIPEQLRYSSIQFDWDKTSWGPSLQINDTRWKENKQNIYLGDIAASLNIFRLTKFDFRLEKITLKNLVIQATKKESKLTFHALNSQNSSNDLNIEKIQTPILDYDKIYNSIKRLGSVSIENVTIYIRDEDINHTYQMPYISVKLAAENDNFQILGYLDDNQTLLQKGGQIFIALNKEDFSFKGKLLIEDFDIIAFKDYGPLYDKIKLYWPTDGSFAPTTIESEFTGSLRNLSQVNKINDINFMANWRLYAQNVKIIFPDWPENPTQIEEIKAKGTFDITNLTIVIQAAEIYADPYKPLYFPETDAAFPIKEAKGLGFFDIQNSILNFTQIQALTDKYTFYGSYKAQLKARKNAHSFSLQIPSMKASDALLLWPKNTASQVWRWCNENIKEGEVKGRLSMRVDLDNDNKWKVNLNSLLDFKNTLFNYNSQAPDIYVDTAQAIMRGGNIAISAPILKTENMNIYNGQVDFENINSNEVSMHLYLPLNLAVKDMIKYIENFNKNLLTKIGLSHEQFEGQVIGHAGMNMIFNNRLLSDETSFSIEELGLYGVGQVKSARIQKAIGEQDISSETLDYELSPKKIRFSGSSFYENQKIDLSYLDIYTISKKQPWAIKASTVVSIPQIHKIFPHTKKGLDIFKTKGKVVASMISENEDIQVNIDLKNASFVIPGVNYNKKVGMEAFLNTNIDIKDSNISLPNIELQAKDLDVKAHTNLTNGKVEKIHVDSFQQSRNHLKAVYTIEDQKDSLNISGKLDLTRNNLSSELSTQKINRETKALDIHADLSHLWMKGNVALKNIKGKVTLLGENLQTADINGTIGNGGISIQIKPNKNKRKVNITSNDGGAIIRGFDINESVYGGKLKITGTIDDTQEKKPFIGLANLTDFTVKNAPALAHLLSILNLVQLDNSLKGNGLTFIEANIPFNIQSQKFYINNGKAIGSTISGTIAGWVSLQSEGDITLSGKIIPFNTLSDTASKIPILGAILTGVDKEGVFAADYKISGNRKNLKVTSNPLSAIAPGVVRDFLNVFGGALTGNIQ